MTSARTFLTVKTLGTTRMLLALALVTTALQLSTVASIAAPSAPAVSAACKKVSTQVVNADKIYIALQYGVVKAAKEYVALENLTNRLNYNLSILKAIQAANVELNFFIKNPSCYSAANFAAAKKEVKANLDGITAIYTDNVNGQLYGNPQKMSTYKPVGLLK